MKTIEDFGTIDSKMLWKDAALGQIDRFRTLATDLGLEGSTVVSTHTSKSIILPVVRYQYQGVRLVLRDNFYDINIWVQSVLPIALPYSDVLLEKDMRWYENEIIRKRGYTYRDWSNKEMDDPRILRVGKHSVSAAEKDRWFKRWESTDWWKDWSGGKLIADKQLADGSFPKDTKFYISYHCFAQGMESLWDKDPPHYEPGSKNFIVAVGGWKHVINLIQKLKGEI